MENKKFQWNKNDVSIDISSKVLDEFEENIMDKRAGNRTSISVCL